MSQKERTKPFVVIELEPYLQDFLFHEFGQPRNHGTGNPEGMAPVLLLQMVLFSLFGS